MVFWHSGIRAAHVEVFATTSVYEVPAFYRTQDSQDGYRWRVVKPITMLMSKLILMTISKPDHFEMRTVTMMQLSVVTNKVCSDHPILTGREYCNNIDLTN